MSIATKRGDGGQTGLAGGIRVSKADLRVESYGSVDELNTAPWLRAQHLHGQRNCRMDRGDSAHAVSRGLGTGHSAGEQEAASNRHDRGYRYADRPGSQD